MIVSLVDDLVRNVFEMSFVSLLIALGLMNVPQFKKLGFNFIKTTIGTSMILDLIARNGQTIMAISTIALAGLLAKRLWIYRRHLAVLRSLLWRQKHATHKRHLKQSPRSRTDHSHPLRKRNGCHSKLKSNSDFKEHRSQHITLS
ncbi:hypothetical protein [Herpetosiphon geysericola]|uniref:Uncharacterized protein n=1 Tax=Herpetosiphon geysericola TaxID=70996 RepID=A0A0P6XTW9_9CHLR|nr:hypothetical protein [Herpetosiphon geysericola]KPL80015.1 hypothetical protein SE18_25885 [Herpetosiphon geysericola]